MKKSEQKSGHLFIHDVTQKEAEEIVAFIHGCEGLDKEADWWPEEEVSQFDNAAIQQIKKSSNHFPRGIAHFQKKIGDPIDETI